MLYSEDLFRKQRGSFLYIRALQRNSYQRQRARSRRRKQRTTELGRHLPTSLDDRWPTGRRETTFFSGEIEELSVQGGNLCWKWRGSNIDWDEKTREQHPLFWIWGSSSSGSVSLCVGLGDALQLPEEDTAGGMWVLRAPEASAV